MDLDIKPRMKAVGKRMIEPRCFKCGSELVTVANGYKCSHCDWTAVIKETKVGKLQKMWMKINGNKTLITGTLWLAARIIFPSIAVPVDIIGGALTGTNVIHKGSKAVNKSKNKAEEEKNRWDSIIKFIIELLSSLKKGG